MLSKQRSQQSAVVQRTLDANDRALAANEKALDLLERQLARETERSGKLEDLIRDLAKIEHNNTQVLKHFIEDENKRILDVLELLEKQIANVAQVAGVPKSTIPTVEELLAEARSDPARRKALEAFMQESEFADTEIHYQV